MSIAPHLAAIIGPIIAPVRVAGRARVIDAAILSLAALLILTGGGLWLAAGFGLLVRVFGVEGALLLGGVVLWTLALLLVLVRVLLQRSAPRPVPLVETAPASDPLVKLVFDLSFMAGRALSRGRR